MVYVVFHHFVWLTFFLFTISKVLDDTPRVTMESGKICLVCYYGKRKQFSRLHHLTCHFIIFYSTLMILLSLC